MKAVAMQELKLVDLDKARQQEQKLEGLIVDAIIIATSHGFDLPEELKPVEDYLEKLKRVRFSISMSQE